MRWLFVWLALAGCKHFSETQVASHTDAATAAQTETHEVKESGPEHIIMTVEEYEQLCPGDSATAAAREQVRQVGQADGQHPPDHGEKQRARGQGNDPHAPSIAQVLVKRTVTVTDRGPSLDDLRSLSTLQSKVNTALQVKEEKKSGPAGLLGLLGSLWPVVLIGGAVLAGFVVWRAKPNWLSFLFKLLGRTP